jgi:hypothetical protein
MDGAMHRLMFVDVRRCSSMFVDVRRCPSISLDAARCPSMPQQRDDGCFAASVDSSSETRFGALDGILCVS